MRQKFTIKVSGQSNGHISVSWRINIYKDDQWAGYGFLFINAALFSCGQTIYNVDMRWGLGPDPEHEWYGTAYSLDQIQSFLFDFDIMKLKDHTVTYTRQSVLEGL